MKDWLTLPLVVLLATSARAAAADLPAFDEANRLYGQGKFRDAASAYSQLVEGGAASPAIYFNLGNAEYKSGNIGRAIVAYRRAEQLAPRDPDLRANLEFLRNQVQGPSLQRRWIERVFGQLTINEWTAAALIPFWVALLSLTFSQLRPVWKTRMRSIAIGFGIASALGFAALAIAWKQAAAPLAVVVSDEVAVRNGPLEESPSAFAARDGAELRVLDEKGDWIQVSAGNRTGWLKHEAAAVLKRL